MNDNHESTITVFVATIMIALTLSAAVCLFPLKVIAADKPEAGTLSIVFENDLFYDSDRHYTNGVRISWLVGPNTNTGLGGADGPSFSFVSKRG